MVTDAAAETVEGAVKPASDLNYVDAEAVARTIAHFLKVRKQHLADTPQLEGAIRNRLAHGVLRRAETQVLSGDGAGENLRGILNTAGIGLVTYNAAPLAADQALEGLVAVLQVGRHAELRRAPPQGLGQHAEEQGGRLGGVLLRRPLRRDRGAAVGYRGGPRERRPAGRRPGRRHDHRLHLFVREGVTVLISDSDQDDFVRNRVTLLGEGRFALAVWQPSAFARVNLTA